MDAIWCLTLNPLPPTACGLVQTPLSIAPNAEICVFDQPPPQTEDWPAPGSLLSQVITSQTPIYCTRQNSVCKEIDTDLGDALFGAFNVSPLAIVPLVANSATWGVLVVGKQNKTGETIAENDRQLLTYLAQHFARSLRQLHLSENAKRHAETIYSLNQIAHTITSSLDIDDVIQKTMAGINATLDVEAGSLLLLDENTQELYFKITLRGENRQITSYRLQPTEGIAGWVITNNRPTIVNHAASDTRFTNKIDKAIGFKTRSLLCTPLVVQGKPIGVLEVVNKRNGLFTELDLDLLVSMAASLGIALKNALLYDSAQERAHQNEVINQITAAINAGRGLSETAKYIFMQFDQRFSFNSITLSLIDRPTTKIRQWILNERGAKEYSQAIISLENSRLATIIKRGHGYIESDIASPAHKPFPDDEIDLKSKTKSRITIPLITQNSPFGSFSLGSQALGAFGLHELKLLDELAPHLSMVIEKALLLDDMKRRANELHLLNRLSEMLAISIDIEVIIETALNTLPRILPNDIHGIVILDEAGAHTGLVVPTNFKNPEDVIDKMVGTTRQLLENETLEIISTKTIAANLPVSETWQPVTTLFLPILAQRVPQGIIYTASGKKEHFSDDFLRIFSLFVSQITAAVQNSHLFQQVEQEHARLAAILASSTDAVLVVNKKGLIVLDNPAAWKIFNATESQSGRLLSEATRLESLVNLFNSAMRGGKTTGEIALMDGRTFFANLSPVSVEEFGVIGWVAIMQDVSHFKELEQLKDEFVSTVSHDLRSPLASILIATQMVEQIGPVSDQQRPLLDLVEQRVGDMTNLTENLLDVGRIEAGIDMEFAPCHIEQVVMNVTEALQSQADKKNIRLAIDCAENLPPILSNTERLHQVVQNLVNNAIKYTPEGGKVTIKAFAKDGEIQFQVIDTGPGIPAGDQPHVFEKFYRVKGQQALKIKGTGLGLAIVKSIVEKHHGRIWLNSVFGEGSTFTVALPIYSVSENDFDS